MEAHLDRAIPEEVAPWGLAGGASMPPRPGQKPGIIPETDPFARLDGKTAAEFYRAMMATCSPAAYGVAKLKHAIFSEGWAIEPGTAQNADAMDLRDWTAAWMSRRSLRMPMLLDLWADYLFHGWGLFQRVWRDWDWSRTVSQRRRSKRFKVPEFIIEKDTRLFAFNQDRDLVYRPGLGTERVYKINSNLSDRMQWATPRWGSVDVPYGRSVLRGGGTAAAYLVWKDLWSQWQQGVDRSQGILWFDRLNLGAGKSIADTEVQEQIETVVQYMNSTGILVPPEGWRPKWLENTVAYAEGWKDPLDRLDAWLVLSTTGQALSVGLGRSGSGSRAAAEVEEGRTENWAQSYARDISNTIGETIDLALEWNWGSVPEDLCPKLVFRSTRSISPERLRAYVQVFQFQPGSDPPDSAAIADDFGIPLKKGGEWAEPSTFPVGGGDITEGDDERPPGGRVEPPPAEVEDEGEA